MSAAVDAILADFDSIMEFTAEIDSAKRSDGTLKTWYFSTHPRATGAGDTPANTEFLPFLPLGGTLGPLSQSLAEDILFAGLAANNPGNLTVVQNNIDNDQLSSMNDYVFAGYEVRIKIGKVQDTSYSTSFAIYRTAIVNIDPTVQLTSEGLQASFQLSSVVTRMLEEELIVNRYVGIPTCAEVLTTTAVAQAAYFAAHDLKTFTLMYKVKISALPATNRNLIAKSAAGTNNNFALNLNTTGVIESVVSFAGVSTSPHISATSLADNKFHIIVWGLLDKTTSYLMIDGEIISTYIPTASVDLPAVGVRMARFLIGKHLDARLYNRYIDPDEAKSISSVRSDGQDLGCVGCWRFDDGGASTIVNDYSPTGADATWTGVLNTDYRWSETDLGEPELAGQLYPLNVGDVLNAKAHLIDAFRQRYRGNDGSQFWYQGSTNLILRVRSQGTLLTGGGVDYTAPADGGGGVFSMTSQEAEPVIYDLVNDGDDEYFHYPSHVAYNLLVNRTRVLGADISNVDPLLILCPWVSGFHTDRETTAKQALEEIIGNNGMHYREDDDGSIWLDMFLPPTGYGPYREPCLDLRGGQSNRIEWGDIADITGSLTICGWIKLQVLDQTANNWGVSEPNQGSMFLVTKGGLPGNYSFWFQAVGADAGKLKFRTAGTTLASPAGVLNNDAWYFTAGVFDDAANTMKIYVGRQGGSLFEVASGANTGIQSTNSLNLMIGDSGNRFPWMSVQHMQIWNAPKTKPQLEALMATPPVGNESGLVFYAPVNEGLGDPLDIVSQTTGTISYASPLDPNGAIPQWAPKLLVNLYETPSVKLVDFHHIHPVSDTIVKYAKNRHPLDNSDIDTGVSQNDRLALTREGLKVRLESKTVKDRFKNSKKIVLDSSITDQESAQRLLRVISTRFNTDRYVAVLQFPPGLQISRLACGLSIGDEIGLIAPYPSQLWTPRAFRVASVAPNPLQLSTTVAIFGFG